MWCLFTHYLSMGEEVCCSGMQVVLVKVFIIFIMIYYVLLYIQGIKCALCKYLSQKVWTIPRRIFELSTNASYKILHHLQTILILSVCTGLHQRSQTAHVSHDSAPLNLVKPYVAGRITLEINIGGAQISTVKTNERYLSWQALRTVINQPKTDF